MVLLVDDSGRLRLCSQVVGVLLLVDCPLVLALHELQLRNDRGLVDGRFDSLVIVDQGPEDSGCVRFDLGVLVMCAQEGEEARQEVIVLKEVNLVLPTVQRCIPDEEQNRTNELIEWTQSEVALCDA